jgi:glutamate-1-semialdehyde 2,1-aminomutase
MFGLYFSDEPVTSWITARKADTKRFGAYFLGLLENGVYVAPSQFEAGFLSTAHDEETIEMTIRAARKVMATL